MSLTFGQAREILKPYCGDRGKGSNSSELNTFVLKVLQYLLITGSPGGEKVFEIYTSNGYFTAPYELETPLKVKVNGRVGNAVNKWFEFRSGISFDKSLEASDTLFEDGNHYFTAYDIPVGGAQIGVKGTVEEDSDANIIIAGDDVTGREIFTKHKGGQVAGELLKIEKNVIRWTNVTFDKIVGVTKSPTNGYVQMYWRNSLGVLGFLADYSPVDESPTYRRFKIAIPECPSEAKIQVLGRVRLKNYYASNDRIPFDNLYNIEVAGQQVQSQGTNQLEAAKANDNFLVELVGRDSTHKKPNNGQPLEVFQHNSAGTIKGIVRR